MAHETYASARPVSQSSLATRRKVESTTANREPLLPPSQVVTYSVFHTKSATPGPAAVVELYGKDEVFLCSLQFWETTLPDDARTVVNFPISNLSPILDTLRTERPCYLLSTKAGFWVGAVSEPVGELGGDKGPTTTPPSNEGGITIEFPTRSR